MKRILDRWEEELYSVGTVKMAKLVALITISAHWLCCGWYFVGCPLPDEEQVGWVIRSYGEEHHQVSKQDLYYDSAFWALMAVVMVRDVNTFARGFASLNCKRVAMADRLERKIKTATDTRPSVLKRSCLHHRSWSVL